MTKLISSAVNAVTTALKHQPSRPMVVCVEIRGKNKQIVRCRALIDSGSQINCVHPKIARLAGLSRTGETLLAETANRRLITCEGVEATINLRGFPTTAVRAFEMDSCLQQVILGTPFLEEIGLRQVIEDFLQKGGGQGSRDTNGEEVGWGYPPMKNCVAVAIGELNEEMTYVLGEFQDLFEDSTEKAEIRRAQGLTHRIDLVPGAVPVARAPYRGHLQHRSQMKARLNELKDKGYTRNSESNWASPALFVPKKPGQPPRFCCDYRLLNQATVPNVLPMPRVDESLWRLKNAKLFTKLDLANGFHQLALEPQSQPLTAFSTPFGLFEWTVMPFGIRNGPAAFCQKVVPAFQDFVDEGVLTLFIDDFLIHTDEDGHWVVVRRILERCRAKGLVLGRNKCEFGKKEVEFIGRIIGQGTVRPQASKVAVLKNFPLPRTGKDLQRFMGFANYLQSFIPQFVELAAPLWDLLKGKYLKRPLDWTEGTLKAFRGLRNALSGNEVLNLPDPSKPFVIHCDASKEGVGAALLQEDNTGRLTPISFIAKKFNRAEANYPLYEQRLLAMRRALSEWETVVKFGPVTFNNEYYGPTYDKELAAIGESLQTWQKLIQGQQVRVETDHKPLTHLHSQKRLTERQLRWMEFFGQFDLTIEHIPGVQNCLADYLSRTEIAAVGVDYGSLKETIVQAARDGDQTNLTWVEGMPMKEDRIYIGPNRDLKEQILEEAHASPVAGHQGARRTIARIKATFTWEGLTTDATQYCARCAICGKAKKTTSRPFGLLRPLPIAEGPWQDISLDFLTGLPQSTSEFDALLVVVDRFSKQIAIIPTVKAVTAEQTADLLFREIVRHHGTPRTITCDRDSRFACEFWTKLMKQMGTKLQMSTAAHPETDGQTERANRSLLQILRCLCGEAGKDWIDWIVHAEIAYNTSVQASN